MIRWLRKPKKQPIDWVEVMRRAYGSPTDIDRVWQDRELGVGAQTIKEMDEQNEPV